MEAGYRYPSKISEIRDGVVGNKLLPANIRQDIIERTDGVSAAMRRLGRLFRFLSSKCEHPIDLHSLHSHFLRKD
jgi:hypothetical protein